jgi:hypothetical protein
VVAATRRAVLIAGAWIVRCYRVVKGRDSGVLKS